MSRFKVDPQVLVTIAACGGAFVYGNLLGWSAPTAPKVMKQYEEDFYFWVSRNHFALVVAMMALGATTSCVFSGILRRKIGTRFTILLFGIPITIGWALITFPLNTAMLLIGRFLCGISAGCYYFVLPMYIREILPNETRVSVFSIFQAAILVGVLFVYTVGHFVSYRILSIVCWSISILFSLGFLALPESPKLLVKKNREVEARTSLMILRGEYCNADLEIDAIKVRHEEMKNNRKSFSDAFKTKASKKAFAIILTQFFLLNMTGMYAVLHYSTIIFIEARTSLTPGIASIIIASVFVVASLRIINYVDRFGRKVLLCISNCLMTLGMIGVAVYFTIKDHEVDANNPSWLPIISLGVFTTSFVAGVGPVSFSLLGELFLPEAKIYIVPITHLLSFLLLFTMGLTFPMLTHAIGHGTTFFIFAGFCFIALNFTYFIIPETKGMSTADIQNIL